VTTQDRVVRRSIIRRTSIFVLYPNWPEENGIAEPWSYCAECGLPTLDPVYFMGTSGRCPDCHEKRMAES
jgi:hypothetical protein